MDIKELNIFSQSTHGIRHPWETVRLKMVKLILRPLLDKSTSRDCLLDIGCGDAYIIKNLADKWTHLNFIGIDSALTDEHIEAIANKISPLKNNVTLYPSLSTVGNFENIKIVLLLDILEHVRNDQAFLCDIVGRLHPNAHMLITVPAFQNLYCRHDKWLGHCRRYTKSLMLNRIKVAGLNPVRSGYFFSSLLMPRFTGKIRESIPMGPSNREPTGIGEWKYGRFIHAIISSMLYVNGYTDIILSTIGIPVPGLSLFVLCKK